MFHFLIIVFVLVKGVCPVVKGECRIVKGVCRVDLNVKVQTRTLHSSHYKQYITLRCCSFNLVTRRILAPSLVSIAPTLPFLLFASFSASYSLTHSLTHSLTYSLIHSLTLSVSVSLFLSKGWMEEQIP